ncbi:MAG: (E)-4-hydroxy-3-methylbut-2-enyl-diphosphate synthase [Sphaerochaetaceae bacterium]
MARTAHIGTLVVGKGHPVLVQTMYDSPIPHDEEHLGELMRRLTGLKAMGCDIIRFSYPSVDDHDAFRFICIHSPMPVVADIHFDYRCALDAIACGCQKIRINPGNIGQKWMVEDVVRAAGDHGVAIRIGLNGGSLPRQGNKDEKVRMVDSAIEYLSLFDGLGFDNTVVSLKSSDPETCYEMNTLFARRSDCPLHIGVTEAGSVVSSVTRSTWAMGRLLSQGIGDTLRVSITGPIETEVQAGVELLRTLGLRTGGIRIVSCPRCGRCTFDTQGFLASVEDELLTVGKDLTVAIMGCQVNGPGEAKHSDIAITGIGRSVFLYKKGVLVREVKKEDAKKALFEAIAEC